MLGQVSCDLRHVVIRQMVGSFKSTSEGLTLGVEAISPYNNPKYPLNFNWERIRTHEPASSGHELKSYAYSTAIYFNSNIELYSNSFNNLNKC